MKRLRFGLMANNLGLSLLEEEDRFALIYEIERGNITVFYLGKGEYEENDIKEIERIIVERFNFHKKMTSKGFFVHCNLDEQSVKISKQKPCFIYERFGFYDDLDGMELVADKHILANSYGVWIRQNYISRKYMFLRLKDKDGNGPRDLLTSLPPDIYESLSLQELEEKLVEVTLW